MERANGKSEWKRRSFHSPFSIRRAMGASNDFARRQGDAARSPHSSLELISETQHETNVVVVRRVFALMMLPVYERIVYGRVHRVMAWGSVAVFVSVPLRGLLARTEVWQDVTRWLVR